MTPKSPQRLLTGALLAVLISLGTPAVAAADLADLTSVSVSVTGNTVTVSGTWSWTRANDCNGPFSGVGFAVEWSDPNEPGNHVATINGDSVDVGTPNDNAVHNSSGGTGGGFDCGTRNGGVNTGSFGGLSHTYTSALPSTICVVAYDVHGTPDPPTAKDTRAGGASHNRDNTVEEDDELGPQNRCASVQVPGPPPGPVNTSEPSANQSSPAIALGKNGPASATAGSDVGFVLTVTNPGNEALTGVTITDARCDVAAPARQSALTATGPDASPDSLDPGDVWTYTCSAHTAATEARLHNEALVAGTTPSGATVTAVAAADVPLLRQGVEPLLAGAARLSGPSGCISRAARRVVVRGTRIRRVSFSLDGRHVGTRDHPNRGSAYTMTVRGSRLRMGAHRIVAKVTFKANTNPRTRTLRLSLARCAATVRPTFTG